MARLKALASRIDALSFKERVLLLAAAVLLIAFAWDGLLLRPLALERTALAQDIARHQQAAAALEAEAARIVAQAAQDPDAATRARIAQLRDALASARRAFADKTADLIDPRQMARVLESVLSELDALAFVGIESLPSAPLLAVAAQAGALPAGAAFRHGMRIRFRGGFAALLAYLQRLEALPYGFFWDTVDYTVDEYPRGEASVIVYTLSAHAGWMGA